MGSQEFRRRGLCFAAVLFSLSSFVLTGGVARAAGPAHLDAGESHEAISGVQRALPDLIMRSSLTGSRDSFDVEGGDGASVSIPRDASQGITLGTMIGEDVNVLLPEASRLDAAVLDSSDRITYPGTSSYVSTVSGSEDGAQFVTTIGGAEAPREYTYEMGLPAGASLAVDEESGAVVALTSEHEFLFIVTPPWAVDAAGSEVETRFEVDGDRLTQIVDHQGVGFVYPIVADPTINSALINSYKWIRDGSGWKISVAVKPAMAFVDSVQAASWGWSQLTSGVKKKSSAECRRLNTTTMKQQWDCHAAGKLAIGVGGWLGIDKKPTWDLETY